MEKRTLRIFKYIGPAPYHAVCTRCNEQFRVTHDKEFTTKDATRVIQEQFDAHKCKRVDSNRNALGILREADRETSRLFLRYPFLHCQKMLVFQERSQRFVVVLNHECLIQFTQLGLRLTLVAA